jgi:catalase
VAALAPPTGPALGHRRNHAKGICFTGEFEANAREWQTIYGVTD